MFKATDFQIELLQIALISWFKFNGRVFPWRETRDPYKVLVAEVLLHQTFARKVVPVYSSIVSRYPTVYDMARADENEVREIIAPLGFLYRASTLVKLGEKIIKKHGGIVPDTLEGLMALPGVGEYTAHAILCFSYGNPVPVVDRNIIRVYKRLFSIPLPLAKINPTKNFWSAAKSLVPHENARDYNLALLDFAALVCKHYSPSCSSCNLAVVCGSPGSL